MHFGLLGPFTCAGPEGEAIRFSAAKPRALLAYLALRAGSAVSPAELTQVLWGDHPPATYNKTLQNYVADLRRALPPGTIETEAGRYRLCVSPDQVDVTEFESRLRAASDATEAGDSRLAAAETAAALGLWRGDPLPDLADHPIGMAEAARLNELRRNVEERNFAARLERGEHADLVPDLEAAVAAEPWRERRWEQLMVALYRCGRQTDALRAYQRLRAALGELGVEPGERARDLEAAILAHDPEIGGPSGPGSVAVSPDPPQASRLPRGNVTFLITEVDDAARLLQRLGSDYPALRDEHRAILRSTVAAYDGVDVDTEGDGLFAVFGDAGQAITACIDAQRSLRSHTWPDGVDLQVQMGLHTGLARPTAEGGYVSLTAHQAGRICAAAHGGQILLSADTARLVRHFLPPDAGLVDRGPFLLSGFDEAERIYQLTHPELASVFPPLRASPAQSHNLPDMRLPFVGRQLEVQAVEEMLGEGRLVTVVGAGGAGKTRLAVEVAARLAAQFPGGVHLCDLSTQSDARMVDAAIGEAFGIRDASDALSEVSRMIGDTASLIVLDSCEHLLEGVAFSVDTLLASSSGLRILATSREVLDVDGEHLWRLGALQLPEPGSDTAGISASEAVQLFIGRARLVQPGFTVNDANAAAVAEVCRQLEGLPLAIELAAAQVGALSPASIADRLQERHEVSRVASERRGGRHRSLEATVDWSYQLLDDGSRRLLRMLSVFANGFTLDAVSAVSDSPDPVDVLTKLVDKSLIVWDPDASRYRMLESIRAFARARLEEAGEADGAAARHLSWCAALADSLRSLSSNEAYDLFGRELDNFRVALVWAASHSSPEAARLAGAVQTEGPPPPPETASEVDEWELVVRADRAYFDRVEVEGAEFPDVAPERRFALSGDRYMIGRARASQNYVPDIDLSGPPTDVGISRQHAVLTRQGDGWSIIDPGSLNGVYIDSDEEPLPRDEPVALAEGRPVHIGAWTSLMVTRRPRSG